MNDIQSEENQDLFGATVEETRSERLKSLLRSRKEAIIYLTLEHLTAVIAILCILFVLTFYFGFLRGKTVAHEEIREQVHRIKNYAPQGPVLDTTPQVPEVGQSATKASPRTPPVTQTTESKQVAKSPSKPYTIQVVTYRSRSRAQKEIKKLQGMGYSSFLLEQGAFFVVSVGEYNSRQEARKDLSSLKRNYPDRFLRKF